MEVGPFIAKGEGLDRARGEGKDGARAPPLAPDKGEGAPDKGEGPIVAPEYLLMYNFCPSSIS